MRFKLLDNRFRRLEILGVVPALYPFVPDVNLAVEFDFNRVLPVVDGSGPPLAPLPVAWLVALWAFWLWAAALSGLPHPS